MPRLPKFIHPIRKVREVLGEAEGRKITQNQFGRRLGVSGAYIQRIELGTAPPPERLCMSLARMTGVDLGSLKSKRSQPKMASDGAPVSGEAIRQYKEFRDSLFFQSLDVYGMKHAEISLTSLCFAAGPRADAVLDSFDAWINGAIREFKLGPAFDREFMDRATKWNTAMKKSGDLLEVETTADQSSFSSGVRTVLRLASERVMGQFQSPEGLRKAFDRGISD